MIDDRFYQKKRVNRFSDLFDIAEIKALVIQFDNHILDQEISSVQTLAKANKDDLSFFANKDYREDFINTKAGFCITSEKFSVQKPEGTSLIISHDPYRLYALCADKIYDNIGLKHYPSSEYRMDQWGGLVHKDAYLEDETIVTASGVVIDANVQIGRGTKIQANTHIASGSTIGRDCLIQSNVSISHSLIGDNVTILSGCRIGQEGFGFAMGVSHQAVPQLGRVIIQDKVHIGANVCIDRGAIDDTIIGEGSCIDNMVQIAHNVVIGTYCVIAGNTSIAGSVTFGDYVVCGGHSCIAGHLKIGSKARISGGAGVMRDVTVGSTVAGSPAFPFRTHFKMISKLEKIASGGSKE